MSTNRSVPQSVPRQKTYIYIFLISLTGMLIYFYSYPLSTEHWTYISQTIEYDASPDNQGQSHAFEAVNGYQSTKKGTEKSKGASILQKLLPNLGGNIGTKNAQLESAKVVASDDASKTDAEVQSNGLSSSAESKVRNNEQQNDFAATTDAAKVTQERNSGETSDKIRSQKSSNENISPTTEEQVENLAKTIKAATGTTRTTDHTPVPMNKDARIRTRQVDLKTTWSQTIQEDFTSPDSAPTNADPSSSSTSEETTNENTSPTAKEQVDSLTKTAKDTTTASHPVDYEPVPVYKDAKSGAQRVDLRTTSSQTNNEMSIHEVSTTPEPEGIPVEGSPGPDVGNTTSDTLSGIQKGYLVFSEQCRIPDIDPMHPSIAHLISKTPPLDCSKNHQPLTRTEGHVLYLNRTEALKLAAGDNYTCCYRSVFREKEGQSDDSVGFGKDCIAIRSDEATVRDEFITVQCRLGNGTTFYEEFHSFIFDKPKVEKRCNRHGTKHDAPNRYSVLIVGVDSVSRLNMHRQLNATARYLLREMDAVEMYGFNKVGDNTFPNLVPLLLGYDERELSRVCWKSRDIPLDRCDFLWKRYARSGYRTLYAEDTPHISSFNYVKQGFYLQPTDYYFRPFILAYEDALGRDKPLNCHLCVGSTSETEAVLHWTGQFASHFADTRRPYFAFSWINSVTHDYLNAGSSADLMYELFFRELHRTGALDRTVVVLMGDHGMRWGDIRGTYVGRLEERLPMLVISLPRQFQRDHPGFAGNLRRNSRRLVTPFDLHATLDHLLNLTADDWEIAPADDIDEGLSANFTRRAKSLFLPVPADRSCEDASVEEHWCTCEASLEVDTRSRDVRRVAEFLLDRVNGLLEPVSRKCAPLELDSVSDARLWQPPAEHGGHSADDGIFTAVIRTSPGGAVFEGTVRISRPGGGRELLGTISRLNLYGNQSACVNDAVLKKYCYCL